HLQQTRSFPTRRSSDLAIPVAWLSLEPQDDEPARFLSYLLAALQTYDPHVGTIRQVLHHQPPSMESILTLLINSLLLRRATVQRSEEHTSELQSRENLV